MKSRSISKERRVLWSAASETLRRFTAPDQSLGALLHAAEVKPYTESWKRPASLLALSATAAKKAMGPSVPFKGNDVLEDIAGDVMLAYWELRPDDRPNTQNAFEVWAYKAAKAFCHHIKYGNSKDQSMAAVITAGPTAQFNRGIGYEGDLDESGVMRNFSFLRHNQPMQMLHLEAMDALKMIFSLGAEDQRFVISIVEGGDVVGLAADNNISLFEAMARLKKCRQIMNRIADDLADEKKFA